MFFWKTDAAPESSNKGRTWGKLYYGKKLHYNKYDAGETLVAQVDVSP